MNWTKVQMVLGSNGSQGLPFAAEVWLLLSINKFIIALLLRYYNAIIPLNCNFSHRCHTFSIIDMTSCVRLVTTDVALSCSIPLSFGPNFVRVLFIQSVYRCWYECVRKLTFTVIHNFCTQVFMTTRYVCVMY